MTSSHQHGTDILYFTSHHIPHSLYSEFHDNFETKIIVLLSRLRVLLKSLCYIIVGRTANIVANVKYFYTHSDQMRLSRVGRDGQAKFCLSMNSDVNSVSKLEAERDTARLQMMM